MDVSQVLHPPNCTEGCKPFKQHGFTYQVLFKLDICPVIDASLHFRQRERMSYLQDMRRFGRALQISMT